MLANIIFRMSISGPDQTNTHGELYSSPRHDDSLMHRLSANVDLIVQYPILNSTHHLLPSPHGELAPAIEAVLDVYGTEVVVVVAHNGQGWIVFDSAATNSH